MADLLLNKVAVVTGAGSGIGRAIARQFLQEGAKVVLAGRNRKALEQVAATAPARSHVQICDITRMTDRTELVTTTARKFGKVDLIVPCAGLMQLSSDAVDAERMHLLFRINCEATCQTVTDFDEQINRQASIIFITADGIPQTATMLSDWLASKAGLKSLALSLAARWKHKSIRVNCLAPKPTQTDCWQQLGMSKTVLKQLHQQIFSDSKENIFLQPETVARVAAYLGSDNARGIHTQEIIVDQ